MKKIFMAGIYLTINQYLMAGTSGECMLSTQEVTTKMQNISENKDNLSKIAKKNLYKELSIYVEICLSTCSGGNFSYCNSVAKEIEESK